MDHEQAKQGGRKSEKENTRIKMKIKENSSPKIILHEANIQYLQTHQNIILD